jgi:hypothetical protein
VLAIQRCQLAAAQACANQERQNCPVPNAFDRRRIGRREEARGLISCEPVTQPDAALSCAAQAMTPVFPAPLEFQ